VSDIGGLALLVRTLKAKAGKSTYVSAGEAGDPSGSPACEGRRYSGTFAANQKGHPHREERQSENDNEGEVGEVFKHQIHRSISRLSGD
jgi:hypothetical protein